MRRFKFIFILAFFAFSLQGQWVDSSFVNFNNDTLTIHIEGDIFILDPDGLKRISDTIISDSVLVDVFFLPCSPLQMYTPYDTTFNVVGSFKAGQNYLRLYTILYEDTIGSCYGYTKNVFVDTVYFSFNVPLSNNEPDLHTQLKPFPNPTTGMVSFELDTPLDKIVVLNSTGQVIETVHPQENQIDLSEYKSGIYILRLYYDGLIETYKVVKH